MRELSLFSGAGGGLLASKLLKWMTLGYVEKNEYCQKVIKQRIIDGFLDDAPIFGDIDDFINQGYAGSYTGMVDVVSGGFPCQPFSQCGHQKGAADIRNKWPSTCDVIKIVKPKFAFLENVANIIVSGYFGTILGDLAEIGYNVRWCVLGGFNAGSIVDGKRLWIFAIKTDGTMLESVDFQKYFVIGTEESFRRQYSRANGATLSQDDYTRIKRDHDAVARGMERLEAIGNGQIPGVAALAWKILSGDL